MQGKIFFLLFTLLSSHLYAKDSKLDLGVGLASLYYPNYIGSKTTNTLLLPFPYIYYTSKYFRIDKNGISAKIFGIDGLRVDLSVSGSLPASSESNGVREGMPDLDLTGEIGFKLVYKIFTQGVSTLEFELPLRAVLSTDFNTIDYRGLVSNPQLKYSLTYNKLEWTLKSGIDLHNADYNNYFYGVSSKYVTQNRPQYQTHSGFAGFKSRIGLRYKHNHWWAATFLSYYNISNANFSDSPLVETNNAFYSGVSIAYIFYTD